MKEYLIDHVPNILIFSLYAVAEYYKGTDGKKENSYIELLINVIKEFKDGKST